MTTPIEEHPDYEACPMCGGAGVDQNELRCSCAGGCVLRYIVLSTLAQNLALACLAHETNEAQAQELLDAINGKPRPL